MSLSSARPSETFQCAASSRRRSPRPNEGSIRSSNIGRSEELGAIGLPGEASIGEFALNFWVASEFSSGIGVTTVSSSSAAIVGGGDPLQVVVSESSRVIASPHACEIHRQQT
jgi:hypothetical protein